MTTEPIDLYGDEEPDYTSEPVDIDPTEAQALSLANWHLREIGRKGVEVVDVLVDVVADDEQCGVPAQDFGQVGEFGRGVDRPGGVAWRVDNEAPAARADRRIERHITAAPATD